MDMAKLLAMLQWNSSNFSLLLSGGDVFFGLLIWRVGD
jgi:hypothetical protein